MSNEVIFSSPQLRSVLDLAKRVAAFPSTILLEGETGSGKEIIADWIYQNSPRASFPFVKINCGAIPETLIESELFGYEKGAFTGANREGNPGLFELADKGTLLLDEVGELSTAMQVKLLRVLQDREIRRVGGSWSRNVDVRVIASTNKNLHTMVEQHQFREDLYYRLNVVHVVVPPLRERKDDILPLLNHFLAETCEEFKIVRRFTDEALGILLNHSYPGNVRELRNLVESLCAAVESEFITPDYVRSQLRLTPPVDTTLNSPQSQLGTLQNQVELAEKIAIEKALSTSGSIRQAAKLLAVSHTTLLRRMHKYGLQPGEKI